MTSVNSDGRLSTKYEALLLKNGGTIEKVFDSCIFFKYENGYAYRLAFDSKLPEFIMLEFAAHVPEPTEDEANIRFPVIQYINLNYRLVKCWFKEDGIHLSCEGFIYRDEDFQAILKNYIAAILSAYDYAYDKFPEALV